MSSPESEIGVQRDNLGPEGTGLSGAIPEVSSVEPQAGPEECQDSSDSDLEQLERELRVHGSDETFEEFKRRIAKEARAEIKKAEERMRASKSEQRNGQ